MADAYHTVQRLSPDDRVTFRLPDGTPVRGDVVGVDDTADFREILVRTADGRRFLLEVVETLDDSRVGIDRWDGVARSWDPVGETAHVRRVGVTA